MTLEKLLINFYKENGIPEKGGVDKNTFEMDILGIQLNLPNHQFRKDIIHIHDIQHLLNGCDTSWKGEGFIAGWKISNGVWKHFPVCVFSIWAFGYSLWIYPKAEYNGFKKGLNDNGIIDLKIKEADFMKMEFDDIVQITQKNYHTSMGFFQWIQFLFWCFHSQLLFLSPIIFVAGITMWLI
jgi:hypothetical protein